MSCILVRSIDCGAYNKNNGDYYEYPSLLISWMAINYKENGGKKNFSCQTKASISCIPIGEHDCHATTIKNRDYYENPSLTHFTDEL